MNKSTDSLGASAAIAAAPNPTTFAVSEGSDAGSFEACDEALAQGLVLTLVMELTGGGQNLFVAAVSKEWKIHYRHVYPAKTTRVRSVVESVERLHWARKYGYDLGALSVHQTFEAAAEYGDVSVCEELHRRKCPLDWSVCRAAVRNERHGLSILQWLRSDLVGKPPCRWGGGVCEEAAELGKLEMLEWLLTDEVDAPFSYMLLMKSIHSGRIPVLEWVVNHPKVRAHMEALEGEEGGTWNRGAYVAAAVGNLEMLQWLHANVRELCEWKAPVCANAVLSAKSLSMLKWLRSKEVMCPWDSIVCPQTVMDMFGDVLKMPPSVFDAIKQWVHANGHPCNCQD